MLHGPGASKRWKPSIKTVRDDDGKVRTEYKRVVYYKCDLGHKKKNRLRQTSLSFVKTTPKRRGGGQEDTGRTSIFTLSPSVGQDVTTDEQTDGLELRKDC